MAWNIHWQCCFKSFGGTQYAVNIYEQNYNGSIVQLNGAPDPFVTQEDDDDDIYIPIRKQTGYIRIIDTDGLLLESIMPKNNTEKLVRLYSGTYNNGTFTPDVAPNPSTSILPHAKWQGFLCAQAYTQPWDNNAKVLEFPIKGFLAALDDITAISQQLYGVQYISRFFVTAFSALNCSPYKLILSTDVNNIENHLIKLSANTSPCFSGEEISNSNETYYEVTGKTYYDILSSICLLYGMTLREDGDALHFTQYDSPYSYIRRNIYPWADFVNFSNGGTVYHNEITVPAQDLLPSLTFKGSDNTFGFVPGTNRVWVTLELYSGGDSFSAPPVIEDSSPLFVRETFDRDGNVHNFFAQPHPFVAGSNATAYYHGYYRRTDAGVQSYNDMLSHSIINGYTVAPYANDSTLLVTGAMAVRYFYQNEPTDSIKLQEGILVQTQYWTQSLGTTNKNHCFTIASITQIYCQNGYLNLKFIVEDFTFNSTLGKLMYGQNTTSAYPYDSYPNIAISIGDFWWDNDNSRWVSGGFAADHFFRVHVQNGSIVTNKTPSIDVDANDGYFIPISGMTGFVKLYFLNDITVYTNNVVMVSYAHIISGISVAYLPSRSFIESSRKSNKYMQNLQNGFSGEKKIVLTYGTFNNNISSPSLVLENGIFAQFFGYNLSPSSLYSQRPEMHLLERMVSHFSQVRRTLTGIIESGIELMLTIYKHNGRKFFGIAANTNWRDDIQKVKFIEVT